MATNRVYKGYSRFRHIKNGGVGSLPVNLGTPFPLGMECFMSFCGDMEAATPLLAVIS